MLKQSQSRDSDLNIEEQEQRTVPTKYGSPALAHSLPLTGCWGYVRREKKRKERREGGVETWQDYTVYPPSTLGTGSQGTTLLGQPCGSPCPAGLVRLSP